MKNKKMKLGGLFAALFASVILFQNCSGGMDDADVVPQSSSQTSLPSTGDQNSQLTDVQNQLQQFISQIPTNPTPDQLNQALTFLNLLLQQLLAVDTTTLSQSMIGLRELLIQQINADIAAVQVLLNPPGSPSQPAPPSPPTPPASVQLHTKWCGQILFLPTQSITDLTNNCSSSGALYSSFDIYLFAKAPANAVPIYSCSPLPPFSAGTGTIFRNACPPGRTTIGLIGYLSAVSSADTVPIYIYESDSGYSALLIEALTTTQGSVFHGAPLAGYALMK